MHPRLTVLASLRYSARLRAPGGLVGDGDRGRGGPGAGRDVARAAGEHADRSRLRRPTKARRPGHRTPQTTLRRARSTYGRQGSGAASSRRESAGPLSPSVRGGGGKAEQTSSATPLGRLPGSRRLGEVPQGLLPGPAKRPPTRAAGTRSGPRDGPPVQARGLRTTDEGIASSAAQLIFLLVVTTIWLGTISSAREIIKERPVFEREQAVGVGVRAYRPRSSRSSSRWSRYRRAC